MTRLETQVRQAIVAGRYLVSWHADEQCESRGVSAWQLVAEIERANTLRVRPSSQPNPSIILVHNLADGTAVRGVWAWLSKTQRAKLVTVYFDD